MSQVKDSVEINESVPHLTMGIRYGVGAFAREPRLVKAKRLFRGRAGQFMFSRIDTQRGAFAVVPKQLDGHLVTNEFPLYVPTAGEINVGFLLLYFRQQSVLDQIDQVRAGSEGRSRWKEADFESWLVPLPSIAEQRRIVDVMAAVDAQIEALGVEVKALGTSLDRARDQCAQATEEPVLADLLDRIESGRSQVTDGDSWVPGAASILKISAVQRGKFQPREAKFVADASVLPEVARVSDGDLLITRSNTPERVGFAAVVDHVEPDTFMPDLVWRLVPTEPSLTRYLGHALASAEMRARITGAASGTSMSMRKINKRSLGELRLPLIDEAQRADYVTVCDGLASTLGLVERQVQLAKSLRSTLLSALLSQQIEIPESYNVLLDASPLEVPA